MIRPIALLLTVLTGFSGLVYEVTWQKCLATLLGSHSEATAAVLGIYLGGLSVGYSLFGRVTRRFVARAAAAGRPPRLLLLYGCVEAAIGLWALAFLPLLRGVQTLSLALPDTAPGLGFAIDVLLTVLLIGPPTVCMGGTIPILTQALARGLDDATRVHAFVYAFNTGGAFAGALSAGFVLIPWLGLQGVLVAMGAVNLVAGSVFLLLGLRRRAAVLPAEEAEAVAPVPGLAFYGAAALLLGFAMMAIQTVLIRLGGLAFGASHFTFSMVVSVYVLCIALGGFAVSLIPRIRPVLLVGSTWALAGCFALLYLVLDDAPYYAHVLRLLFRDSEVAFYPYYLTAFVGVLGVVGLPVMLSGASLPLLFDHLRGQVGDLGAMAGRLYSLNTLGNLLGALLGGYALLFWVDLDGVYRLGVAAIAAAAALLSVRVYSLPPALGALLLLPVALLGLQVGGWNPHRLASGTFRARTVQPGSFAGPDAFFRPREQALRIPFYDDDPTTSVAVVEADGHPTPQRSILTNGKSDGSVGGGARDYATMAMVALVPCLLAERCERAFVIGLGTGVTAGEFAALDGMQEVVVSEISRGVIEAAPFFDGGNLGVSRNPRIGMLRSDAYRALLRSHQRYDVIASEPSNPWVSGVEMLFSREFLTAARDQLRPGGVYAQWFHTYETDDATVALALRTYLEVFEQVAVWYSYGPDLLILGLTDAQASLDLERVSQRFARKDFRRGLRRSGVASLTGLLAHELLPLGVIHAAGMQGEVHTLYHPILSDRAARAFFVGGEGGLPPTAALEAARLGARHSLLAQHAAEQGLDEALHRDAAEQLCRTRLVECATWVASWRARFPASEEALAYESELAPRLPVGLLADLRVLFGEELPEGQRIGVRDAQRYTRLFETHYVHGRPFERAALDRIWRRCMAADPACESPRHQAEERLGSFRARIRAGSGPRPAPAAASPRRSPGRAAG